jgi:hypothetical protein
MNTPPSPAAPRRTPQFWLGTHMPSWLAHAEVPLMLSHRRLRARLRPRARLPCAAAPWVLDSGGFEEVGRHGRWTFTSEEYAEAVDRYDREIGQLAWAAPMDWMCTPGVLGKTGRLLADHQHRTVANLLALRALAPHLRFIPILQGWTRTSYERCVELYAQAGIDLTQEPVVGVGSIKSRQRTTTVRLLLGDLAAAGIRVHGFGLTRTGLRNCSAAVASADSTAWSLAARRSRPLPGHWHWSCSNCLEFALRWRDEVLHELAALAAGPAPAPPAGRRARFGRSPPARRTTHPRPRPEQEIHVARSHEVPHGRPALAGAPPLQRRARSRPASQTSHRGQH